MTNDNPALDDVLKEINLIGKGQSKKSSFLESCLNILIGYIVAIAAQLIIFPVFGINIPLHENLLIGAFFTIVSLIRSYFIRRLFNFLQVNK